MDRVLINPFRKQLKTAFLDMTYTNINGHSSQRLYNVSNICFKGVDADDIIAGLENIAVSDGSDCSSTEVEPSHVLIVMGLSEQDAYSSLRFSLGQLSTYSYIKSCIGAVINIVDNLRAIKVSNALI